MKNLLKSAFAFAIAYFYKANQVECNLFALEDPKID